MTCTRTCSKRFLSIILKPNVLPECISYFRCSRMFSNSRQTGLLPRFYPCLATNHQYLTPCPSYSKSRYYSQIHTEDKVSEPNGTFEEQKDAVDIGRESVQKTVQDFNIDVMVSLLRQENAVDICVIKVPEDVKYTDYFIVVSGSSSRHLRAMALYAIKVHKLMKKNKASHAKIEGKDADDWMCIDFGSMVVHFMLPETRDLYELEKLWTLRSLDEQLCSIPPEILPEDFIYGADVTK